MQSSRNHPINCGTATSQFARTNPKQTIAQRTADLQFVTEYKTLVPESSSSVTVGDISYTRTQAATSGTSARVNIDYLPQRFDALKSLTSGSPSVLAQSSSDPLLFEYQSSGTSVIRAEFVSGETLIKSAVATTVSQAEQDTFVSFLPGSLGASVYSGMGQFANGATTEPEHYPIYSTYNQTTNTYTRNTGCWVAGLDWSGMMVNKVGSPGVTRVSAITPHHAIGASHYGPEVGDVIYFCDANNQTVARTVSARTDLGSNTDCCIVRFSSPLPGTVAKYKTLPATWAQYAPISRVANPTRAAFWPLLGTSHYRWDQDWPLQRSNRFAYAREVNVVASYGDINFLSFKPAVAFPNALTAYSGEPSGFRGGDSGGPCFFIINGELVLVACLLLGTGGPFHPSFLSQINAALDTLGPGGQTYQTVDLSQFTNFAS